MSKHTPGPWEWDGKGLVPVNLVPPDYRSVMEPEVHCGRYCFGGSGGSVVLNINDADKALIAAAPDLLAAARDALDVFDAQGVEPAAPQYKALEAAIRKAEGDDQ